MSVCFGPSYTSYVVRVSMWCELVALDKLQQIGSVE